MSNGKHVLEARCYCCIGSRHQFSIVVNTLSYKDLLSELYGEAKMAPSLTSLIFLDQQLAAFYNVRKTHRFVEDVAYSVDQHQRRFRFVQVIRHSVHSMQVRGQCAGHQHDVRRQLRLQHLT